LRAYDVIKTKRDGGRLSPEQIRYFIDGYTRGEIPDYQAAALVMAVFIRGLHADELAVWSDAMLRSGEVLDFSDLPGAKVDKHSTGGVGDKISLPLAPLVAACGVRVPMISGRGLGHTGGTLDKLESIPGFRTDLSAARFRELVRDVGLGLIGQTEKLAPADRKLYALRDATATVECIPLIASSIMSKKLAEGCDALVLDVKTGSGAFMKRPADARELAKTMVGIAAGVGKRAVALITDMDQPLGRAVGNALEVEESILTLRGEGPADITELTLALGAEMLMLGGVARDAQDGRARLRRAIEDGSGLRKFMQVIEGQGGDPRVVDEPLRLPRARREVAVGAPRAGHVAAIDAEKVGVATLLLGAGRAKKEDAIDPAVGAMVHRKVGDRVEAGEPLLTLYVNDERNLDAARAMAVEAYAIADTAPAPRPLVLERIA
jgi:pyrimidine-nucleoside phosphorylase